MAGLFASHGVWTGICRLADDANPKGYFENRAIAKGMMRHSPETIRDGTLAPPLEGWREHVEGVLRAQGYAGGPWMMKFSPRWSPMWTGFDAHWVCVRRSLEATFQSIESSGNFKVIGGPEAIWKSLRLQEQQLDLIRDEWGGCEVHSERLVQGDHRELIAAFGCCGIPYESSVVASFVDPDLWHFH